MMEQGYSLADIAAATGNSGGNNNDGFGGNNGAWWVIILLLALGRGFGFGGNGGGQGGGSGYSQPIVIDSGRSGGCWSPCATQADVRAAVDQQTLISKLDNQTYGLADSTYALTNVLNQNFRGIDNAICTLGYNIQGGFNGIQHSMDKCCCETQRLIERGFADTNYNLANQSCETRHAIYNSTRDIIDNANANSRAILDFLTKDKIDTLQSENLALRFQASQSNQNAYIGATIDSAVAELIRRTGNDCPTPAYVVQPPQPVTFATNCCGQTSFAGNGCGGGCGSF